MKKHSIRNIILILGIIVLTALCIPLNARISRIVVTRTEPYLDGRIFGAAGPYIRITGQAYGEVDPDNPLNSIIQDIHLAPVIDNGKVEYISDFVILRPADLTKCNGLLFLSLPNRGNMLPADTFLLSRGYIYVWCAWQGDILAGGNRLTMKVPFAGDNGNEIKGLLRTEYQVSAATGTLTLGGGFFTGNTHKTYETTNVDNRNFTLTRRKNEADPRETVPVSDWAFSDCSRFRFPGIASSVRISLKDDFQPGYIYELIYTAKNPLILGLGFAAIRDFGSFLRYDLKDDAGFPNPLTGGDTTLNRVRAAIIQGVSQCSNFIRSYLFLGFNQDEKNRIVFDGVNAHIGTRRISLNVRFGRPGGGGLQHEDHLFPGNDPPFTWDSRPDPISGITGGILEKCVATGTCPKIMQTLSSSEYWQLRASLTTTDSYGKADLEIPGNVRIYLFSGTQHVPSDGADQMSGFPVNPNSYDPYLRALLVALEKWVLVGKEPPPSCYPRIDDGTLVPPDRESTGWPDIPEVPYNGRVNELPLLDYGPQYDFRSVTGILGQEPPKPKSDQMYRTLVPKVDRDGNETGGIRGINIRVPLGTYTGWSLRREGFGKGDLSALNGMFIPFSKTRKDRIEKGDPRASLKERYPTKEKYVEAVRKAAAELVAGGFLLKEDADAEIIKAQNITLFE